jgi:hypothetical protein
VRPASDTPTEAIVEPSSIGGAGLVAARACSMAAAADSREHARRAQ